MIAGTPMTHASTVTLDYYLLRPAGLLVEEFVLGDDLSALRLRSAGWTAAGGGWWSSAAFALAVRTDPSVRARVTAVDRSAAEEAYRRLGGAALPDEQALRGYFADDAPLSSGAPLRLGSGADVTRILFAGEPDQVDKLRERLHLAGVSTPGEEPSGVIGTGRLTVGDANLRWDLRRIGGGAAWCIDLTSEPSDSDALPWLLRRLTDVARHHGLIPATIDRLA